MFTKSVINRIAGMAPAIIGANRLMADSGTGTSTTTTGDYENGSDILLNVGGGCIARCSTHNIQYNSETKERAVKPVATAAKKKALFTSKGVTKMSITAHAEGFRFYKATENGFEECAALWGKGQSVDLQAFKWQ